MNALRGAGLKTTYNLFFALFLVATTSGYCFADEDADLQAMAQYANSNLLEILNGIPVGEEKDYGFQSRDEFNKATMGIPYQEYDMDKEEPTGYWRIPVMVDGENCALVRLKSTYDGWAFSGFGGAGLAQDLGEHEDDMVSQGKTPRTGRIIRDFSLLSDYVQFDQQAGGSLSGTVYPLRSATQFMSAFPAADTVSHRIYGGNEGYDLDTIKQMRLKALEYKGNANPYDYSNGGARR